MHPNNLAILALIASTIWLPDTRPYASGAGLWTSRYGTVETHAVGGRHDLAAESAKHNMKPLMADRHGHTDRARKVRRKDTDSTK